MRKTYLSLDLDFFNACKADGSYEFERILTTHLERVHRFARNFYLPIVAVMNHQQLLPHVNASGCDRLLNVDTHSDLCESSVQELNCGTWVAYVTWRRTGSFIWWHGSCVQDGDCGMDNLFQEARQGVIKRGVSDWKEASHIRSVDMPNLTSDIKAIGVCLSPMYVDYDDTAYRVFKHWVARHGIPYNKGRRDENYGRKLRP